MRRLLLALTFLSPLCLAAADLSIVRVWPGYRTTESFRRISEFFDGRENTSGQQILRSQPDNRDGFYFLTRVKNPGAPLSGIRAELLVITPAAPDPKHFTFTAVTLSPGSRVLQFGLTGTDWTDPAMQPVAWQLRLLTADGTELAREQSYLWSLPAK